MPAGKLSSILTHTGKTAVAGVIGWPISHSQSPRLHGYWLAKHGIDGAYIPLPVQPDHLREAIFGLRGLGFRGANVTIPFKEKVIPLMDSISPLAQKIGAVNTIIIQDDGQLHGTNTDAPGFVDNLKSQAPHWTGQGRVVVLGAGGAARAICAALADDGAKEIIILNRSIEKAERLAAELQELFATPMRGLAFTAENWAAVAPDCDVLVNTTALGMVNHPPLSIDLTPLLSHAIVSDIVYAPLQTQLLQQAKARNLITVDGLGMLLYQARAGFAAWFGATPDVTPDLRAYVISGL